MQAERDDLSDLSPEEFVAARNELARQLKAEGDVARAAEIKKLRKPTVAQWIADQVRRHHRDVLDALREASSDVAVAQEAAITRGDRDSLREATAERREALKAVGRVVDQVLARSGRPGQYRDEVVSAIESAATAEVASGSFGLRDDLELPAPPEKEPVRDVAAERRAAEAEATIAAAEAQVARARDDLERAESELEAVLARLGGRRAWPEHPPPRSAGIVGPA